MLATRGPNEPADREDAHPIAHRSGKEAPKDRIAGNQRAGGIGDHLPMINYVGPRWDRPSTPSTFMPQQDPQLRQEFTRQPTPTQSPGRARVLAG
jgi:hypothetical protein